MKKLPGSGCTVVNPVNLFRLTGVATHGGRLDPVNVFKLTGVAALVDVWMRA